MSTHFRNIFLIEQEMYLSRRPRDKLSTRCNNGDCAKMKASDRAQAQGPKQAAITLATRYKTFVANAFAFLSLTSRRSRELLE